MTHIFVINSGSSSIKWSVIDPDSESSIRAGIVEHIGTPGADHLDHSAALESVIGELKGIAVEAIGHRVVHGGEAFTGPVVVTQEVEDRIQQLSALAPLHNPANLAGIKAARGWFPHLPQVAVFDTAFHRTLAPAAYTYALDHDLATAHGIRRFGFHGISFQYISAAAAQELARPIDSLKLIVFHLGNGASACAIDGGRSVDTSMGLTPVEGLVMGTRPGDVDPGAILHLLRSGVQAQELDDILNRTGGFAGLTGSSDYRDVKAAANAGDDRAILALKIMHHRLRHYLGAYLAILGGADAIVFTGGIGEHAAAVREAALTGLEALGIELDYNANLSNSRVISTPSSSVTVLVIATDEELEIARQTIATVRSASR
jgi:acetate kinase